MMVYHHAHHLGSCPTNHKGGGPSCGWYGGLADHVMQKWCYCSWGRWKHKYCVGEKLLISISNNTRKGKVDKNDIQKKCTKGPPYSQVQNIQIWPTAGPEPMSWGFIKAFWTWLVSSNHDWSSDAQGGHFNKIEVPVKCLWGAFWRTRRLPHHPDGLPGASEWHFQFARKFHSEGFEGWGTLYMAFPHLRTSWSWEFVWTQIKDPSRGPLWAHLQIPVFVY